MNHYTTKNVRNFWRKVDKSDHPQGCWIWTAGKTGRGYGSFSASNKDMPAHRVSYELTNGAIPDGLDVLHKCDNPSCVNPDHLFLGTHQDNMGDRNAKGRQAKGEHNGNAKLTLAEVREIRRLYIGGIYQRELAEQFGVGETTIQAIVNNKLWRDLQR